MPLHYVWSLFTSHHGSWPWGQGDAHSPILSKSPCSKTAKPVWLSSVPFGIFAAEGIHKVRGHMFPCPGISPRSGYESTWTCISSTTFVSLSWFGEEFGFQYVPPPILPASSAWSTLQPALSLQALPHSASFNFLPFSLYPWVWTTCYSQRGLHGSAGTWEITLICHCLETSCNYHEEASACAKLVTMAGEGKGLGSNCYNIMCCTVFS